LLAQKRSRAAIPLGDLAVEMARAWPGTSATYLSKVVQALVRGRILVSLRGSAGGYGFARPPAELSLLDIVWALEGPRDARCPLTPSGPCTLRDRCGTHHVLQELQTAVSALLAQLTIDRLARNLPQPADSVERPELLDCVA
jgi:Rrf2 family protein